jgi:hypothetical protein
MEGGVAQFVLSSYYCGSVKKAGVLRGNQDECLALCEGIEIEDVGHGPDAKEIGLLEWDVDAHSYPGSLHLSDRISLFGVEDITDLNQASPAPLSYQEVPGQKSSERLQDLIRPWKLVWWTELAGSRVHTSLQESMRFQDPIYSCRLIGCITSLGMLVSDRLCPLIPLGSVQ